MAGSRDSKRFFCKGSSILDLSNTLEKELGREICQTSLNPLDPMDFPSNVQDFPKFSQNSPTCLSNYSNLKFYLGRPIYQIEIISFAFERALYGLSFDIMDPYMQLIVCLGLSFGKLCKNMEKLLFFRGATAGLWKYHTGSYGWIGIYRVNCTCNLSLRPSI